MAVSRRYTDEQLRRLYESGQMQPPESIYTSIPGRDQPQPTAQAPARGAEADVYRRLISGEPNPFAPQQKSGPAFGPTNERARDLPSERPSADVAMLNSARAVGAGRPSPSGQGGMGGDPYSEFLQGYYNDLAGSYDAQIDAIGGLSPIFKQQAQESQGNIGNFFGYAGDVAREGIPVTQETYANAEGNVDNIYDQLGERLRDMPQELTDVASNAAGSAIGSSVAGRVSAATAPFAAAGETARANANANLTQHSAAGQNYLNQLASSTGAEAGMHQSAVESALNQQLQMVAYRQAEIEGAKQRALMEVSSDIAGASSERMANAALSSALGLGTPEGVDPMDFLRAQGMMQGLQSGELDQQSAMMNLAQESNPNWQRDQVMSGLSTNLHAPLDQVRRIAESSFVEGDDPRNLGLSMLKVLDDMSKSFGEENYRGEGTPLEGALGGNEIPVVVGDPNSRKQIEEAIRALYGG